METLFALDASEDLLYILNCIQCSVKIGILAKNAKNEGKLKVFLFVMLLKKIEGQSKVD